LCVLGVAAGRQRALSRSEQSPALVLQRSQQQQ